LAVVQNQGQFSTFDGQSVNTDDVLVKYTFFGDADLSGVVDASDYTLLDNGFNSQGTATPLTGWFNGDFNGDGLINGDDYTLIDNAYNTQSLLAPAQQVGSSEAQIATPLAVHAATFSSGPAIAVAADSDDPIADFLAELKKHARAETTLLS
jgi:hypothetical protein